MSAKIVRRSRSRKAPQPAPPKAAARSEDVIGALEFYDAIEAHSEQTAASVSGVSWSIPAGPKPTTVTLGRSGMARGRR